MLGLGLKLTNRATILARDASAPVTSTNISKEYSSDIGDVDLDLDGLGTATVGSVTYTLTPYTGVSILGSVVTFDTDTMATGTVIVTRSDDGPDFDFNLAITLNTLTIADGGSIAPLSNLGDDDPSTAVYSGTVTDADSNVIAWSMTRAQYDAIADTRGYGAANPGPALFTDDVDSDGKIDSGDDVERGIKGLWIYPNSQTAPTITVSLRDQSSELVADFEASDYTGDATEDTSIFVRETDGVTNADSSVILVDVGGPLSYRDEFAGASGTIVKTGGIWDEFDGVRTPNIIHNGSGSAIMDASSGNRQQHLKYNGGDLSDDHYVEMSPAYRGDRWNAWLILYLRVTDEDNHYYIEQRGDNRPMTVYKKVAGTSTQIGSDVYSYTVDSVYRFQIEGSTIKILIDDVEAYSETDTALTTGVPGFGTDTNNGATSDVQQWKYMEVGDV